MSTLRLTFSVLSIVVVAIVGESQANLVLNGSFESPGFSGTHLLVPSFSPAIPNWNVAGDGNNVVLHKSPDAGIDTGNSTFNFAHDGNYYLDLSGNGPPHATIYQDFATVPSASYLLSFYIGQSNLYAPAATIDVQLGGTNSILNTTLTPSAPGTNIVWTLMSFPFVADSATTRLSFRGTSVLDDNASYVDSVGVALVPEPGSLTLLLGSCALLLRRRS